MNKRLNANGLTTVDSLMVFLNISYTYSIIPFLLFSFQNLNINYFLITFINISYIFVRFRNIKISLKDPLFLIFVTISVLNIVFMTFVEKLAAIYILYLLENISFFILLKKMFAKYRECFSYQNSVYRVLRGYIWFCLINVFGSVILFILVKIGFHAFINDVSKIFLFKDNVERFHNTYYFPYIAVIKPASYLRIPFFQDDGLITGLTHEPHCFTFLITPSLFLILHKLTNIYQKIFITSIYIFALLISPSATNIISLFLCGIVYYSLKLKESVVKVVFIIVFILMIVSQIDPIYYQFVFDKMSSGSADYSEEVINFAFNPRTIMGTNMFSHEYIYSHPERYDMGYIKFAFNILFLLTFGLRVFQMLIYKDAFIKLLGIMTLYFFLHSSKIAMVAYTLTYFILFIFIVSTLFEKKTWGHDLKIGVNRVSGSRL